jgi:hypothetical protein
MNTEKREKLKRDLKKVEESLKDSQESLEHIRQGTYKFPRSVDDSYKRSVAISHSSNIFLMKKMKTHIKKELKKK